MTDLKKIDGVSVAEADYAKFIEAQCKLLHFALYGAVTSSELGKKEQYTAFSDVAIAFMVNTSLRCDMPLDRLLKIITWMYEHNTKPKKESQAPGQN